MSVPAPFLALVEHPAPGLHFPAHRGAGTPERVLPAPHRAGRPATADALALLRKLTARCPAAGEQLASFYSRWDGFELCRLPDDDERVPQLVLLSIGEWETATEEVVSGELSFLLSGVEDEFPAGGFIVIGMGSSEGVRLLLSLTGSRDGRSTAGAICYASMDPTLSLGEPIAGSFFELLEQIAVEPAEFLRKIGVTHFISKGGHTWGDAADRYIPDVGMANPAADAGDREREDPRQGSLFG